MARILLIASTQTVYGVQHYLMQQFAIDLREMGHQPRIVEVYGGKSTEETIRQLDNSLDLVLSFNNILLKLKDNRTQANVIELLNLPYCGYLLDHPGYHVDRLRGNHPTLRVACVDKSNVSYVQEEFGLNAFYLPHGACRVNSEATPFRKRDKKIVFVGTYSDPPECLAVFKTLKVGTQNLVSDIIHHAEANPLIPLVDVIQSALKDIGLEEEDNLVEKSLHFFVPIDRFIRAKRRLAVIEVLTRAGIQVELFGNWGKSPFVGKQPIHSTLPCDVFMEKVLGDAQIALNILPNYVEGSHERLLSGMVAGAVGLTDTNLFSNEHFTHGEDFIGFERDKIGALPEILHPLLDDPRKLEDIAMAGRENVLENHLWKHRLKVILENFSLV
jgi:hypothetical protein